MSFDVHATSGMVTARIPADAYMDAAVGPAGSIGGVEFAVEKFHAFDGSRNARRAECIVCLDTDPETLKRLALTLLLAVGAPSFNDREWREIANALRHLGTRNNNMRELVEYADRIDATARANAGS